MMFLVFTTIAPILEDYVAYSFPARPALSRSLRSPSLKNSVRRLNDSSSEAQINPSIVVIIVILSIIFFLSGCLHLLIRCITRNPRRDANTIVTLTSLQGELRQLFHLHDSGVEQAFIDTLPVFLYKAVKGLKEGADCAVCLSEFQGDDRLRLLPKCSHAFHLDCIDTWLLSHSTCPLCRRSLLPDGVNATQVNQGALVESRRSSLEVSNETEAGQENGEADSGVGRASLEREDAVLGTQVHGVCIAAVPSSQHRRTASQQDGTPYVERNAWENQEEQASLENGGKVMPVQLGRFRVTEDNSHGEGSSASRRSYSVGAYEYVLDPANLKVVIAPTPSRRRTSTPRRVIPGHRTTLSECVPEDVIPDPITPFVGDVPFESKSSPLEPGKIPWVSINLHSSSTKPLNPRASALYQDSQDSELEDKATTAHRGVEGGERSMLFKQTFSPSQRVLPDEGTSGRRAYSFRLPMSDAKLKVSASRRSRSETEVAGWDEEEHSFSDVRLMNIEGYQSSSNADVSRNMPSIAKRTINWLVGRQRWSGHSSSTSGAPQR